MEIIKNSSELLVNGDIESRKIILNIADKTLQKLDSYKIIKEIASYKNGKLTIGNNLWDLNKKNNVYLIGAGKACNAMAMAIDEILDDRLTKGIIIVKIKEEADSYKNTLALEGGHPLPNDKGLKACEDILRLVDNADEKDLFIAVMSGGSTALMCYPVEGISLQDIIKTNDVLLKSGASVWEINAVRRRLCQINGGKLGAKIKNKGAELIVFSIYDAVRMPETKHIQVPVKLTGTPVGPDETTLEDAIRVINAYNLKNRLPKNVIKYFKERDANYKPCFDLFDDITYFIINTVPDSCKVAAKVIKDMRLRFMILTTSLEGESREAGTFLASIAEEIQRYHRPIKPPCVVLCAGETTTKIPGNTTVKGTGGPSQEMVLSFALKSINTPGSCLLSIDTEGSDGTTLAAGGIVDSQTLKYLNNSGVDINKAFREFSTHEALEQVGSVILTGNTGTNLCDLNIMYVPENYNKRC